MTPSEVQKTHARLGSIIFDPNTPNDEYEVALKAFDELSPAAFQAALSSFRDGTPKLSELTAELYRGILALGRPPTAELARVFEELSQGLASLHAGEGLRTTYETPQEFAQIVEDEDSYPSSGTIVGLPSAPQGLTKLTSFDPFNSTNFADLSNEYVTFFASMEYKSASAKNTVMKYARSALQNSEIYADVGDPLGIPWWFIAGIHLLESSNNFGTHLHNGDPLSSRTFRVPANRPLAPPESGNLPYTWQESARDALTIEGFSGLADWSLARALYRWEAYNGFGYRPRKIATPYLWSFSNVYAKGKYVGDGVFSASAVSKQIGAAVLLRALVDLDAVENVGVERMIEGDGDAIDSDGADANAVAAGTIPNIDGQVSTNVTFKDFFESNAPDVTDFAWHEFLVKGGSHNSPGNAAYNLNTDPPVEKWRNVLPLARVLQKIRDRIGGPIVLTSVYRSPEYNDAIPEAAKNSQHVQFKAADFKVPGWGEPSDWYSIPKFDTSELYLRCLFLAGGFISMG